MTSTAGARQRDRIGWSAAATLVSGVLGWLTMVGVARAAGPGEFASFAVLWALFFGIGGAFAGLQQEVTRSVDAASRTGGRTRLLPLVLAMTAPSAVVVVVTLAAGGVRAPGGTPSGALALALGLVGLGVLTFVNGVLAARDSWFDVALVLTCDALVRTVAVLVVVTLDRPTLLPWAIAAGALAWLPLLVRPAVRDSIGALGADSVRGVVRRALTAMGSTICAALLVAGFPLLVAVARGHDELTASTGVLLATLVLVRSPLLVVLYGFRPAIMRTFLDRSGPLLQVVGRWWLVLGVLGAGGTALAAAVGPWLVRAVFGAGYTTGAVDLAALTAGSVLVAMLVVSGLALVAADRHGASTLGWLLAVVASYALLAMVPTTRPALLLAVLLAPVAGLAVHAAALVSARAPGPTRP